MWTLPFLAKMKGLAPLLLRLYAGASLGWHAMQAMHGVDGKWDGGKAWVASRARAGGWAEALLYGGLWLEFVASALVIMGLLTRWSGLALAGVSAFVLLRIHGVDSLAEQEVWVARGAICAAVVFLGPGSVSLDRLFFGKNAVDA